MKKLAISKGAIATYLSGVLGYGLLIYSTYRITYEGLYQDAHNTGGAIPTIELSSLLLSIILIAVFIWFYAKVLNKVNTDGGLSSKLGKELKYLALLALAGAAASQVIFLFSIPVVVLAVGVVWLAGRISANTKDRAILRYRFIALLTVLLSCTPFITPFFMHF